MNGQSNKHSWFEAWANTLIGYVIAIAAQEVIFPLFDIHVPLHEHLQIGLLFLIVSVVRSYTLRRLFNALQEKKHVR